jgi:cysteine-S-conjugate beta-lyase
MAYDFDRVIDRGHTESSKWRKFGPDVLPLWVADMDFAAPEPVRRALRERVEHGIYGYLLEQAEFYEVVTDRLWKRYGWRVAPEAVVLLPGVIPSFNMAARALTTPGDGMLMQTPVYPPILRCPGNMGLTRDAAALAPRADRGYEVDDRAFARAIGPRTRVFLLCNPHNPVGRVFRREELERMAEECLRHDLVVCADEIHCDLLYPGYQHVPFATLGPEVEARTITLMAPSKTFNLAGLKASMAIITDTRLRERFVAAKADMVHGVNVLGYTALVAAYRDGQEWLDALLRYLDTNRAFLAEYVRTRLPGVRMVAPEGTYLAWLDCREAGLPGGDPFAFFLDRARVALNDGKTFGPGGDGFVRLNFGCPRVLLAEGLERMRVALTEVAAAGR